jgi:predicted nucleic acid-binding protein
VDHLADTNILVRAIEKHHPSGHHARNALKVLRRNGDRVCVTAQNVVEFWSVCTRPVARNGLGLSPQQVARHVSRIDGLFHFLPDVPQIYEEWKRLVRAQAVSGLQVHDARLAAAMKVYGVASILTFNVDDFRRFPGIGVLHPETVVEEHGRR